MREIVDSNNIIVHGFPRSGNHFLNYACLGLYKDFKFSIYHDYKLFDELDGLLIVPVRNPLDCIASFANLKTILSNEELNINMCVNQYIEYFTKALWLNNILFIQFDLFINDTDYIANAIASKWGIKPDKELTVNLVKERMATDKKEMHLPQDNKKLLDEIKKLVSEHPKYDEALHLYEKIKGMCK